MKIITFITILISFLSSAQKSELYVVMPDTFNFSNDYKMDDSRFRMSGYEFKKKFYGFYFAKEIPEEYFKYNVFLGIDNKLNLIYFGEPQKKRIEEFSIITTLIDKKIQISDIKMNLNKLDSEKIKFIKFESLKNLFEDIDNLFFLVKDSDNFFKVYKKYTD
ncbi:hypothetical protein [Flavobacteriaceae bacterium 14752]|uniref:hypothetical protein n=1 Tax=Mesohalobacter salilacus TaxID=2491711 RepID=UPI000F63B8D8|nr:hypothetical protein EIG84_12040 [Flavobacteriaceae bacterium 14752]